MTGTSTPAMDICGGGGRRSERNDSDRTNEDMSFIGSVRDCISFVDLQFHENGESPARAILHDSGFNFGAMPPLKEEVELKTYLESNVPLLPGEVRIEIINKFIFTTTDGFLGVTNYRIMTVVDQEPRRFTMIPLAEIELCQALTLFDMKVTLKGGRIHTIVFTSPNESVAVAEVVKRIAAQLNRLNTRIYREPTEPTNEVNEVFAWEFSRAVDLELPKWLKRADYVANEITHIDFKRLGMEESFRISSVNENFEVCPTYPEKVIVPKSITDEDIRLGATYRSIGRFPAIVWRCTKTRAVLMRSSQPQVGILSWRNLTDEKIIEEAVKASRIEGEDKKQFIIQDARAYTSAFANRARSGGYENCEYYQQAKLEFLGLPNIHAIRGSFESIRTMLHQQAANEQMLQNLQGTGWLNSISNLLVNASNCAQHLVNGHSVLVHCSDGWDRTTQITTLAKLMLDEHYRTIDGFAELIRRDWIAFGHKLSDRNICPNEGSERSPIFSQFLEAVRHLQRVQPTAFQFSHAYLVKLAQHTYSGLFGTFLFNNHKERKEAMEFKKATLVEVWRFLNADNDEFVNQTYDEKYVGPLKGEWNFGVLHLNIWHESFNDRGPQNAQEPPKTAKTSSGTSTPARPAPVLGKSKSTESIKSACDTAAEQLSLMTSSYHQPVVLTTSNAGTEMLDHDGLMKLQDDEQFTLRQKNRLKQEEIQKRDQEIIELRRQRALSEKGAQHSPSHNRRMHSVSESDNEPGLERAMSDLSMVDPEMEMPNFRANTTWETKSECCYLCKRTFIEMTMYTEDRQHHCRNCGKVVCDACSKRRYAVVEEGKSVQKRACDVCYNSMHVDEGTTTQDDEPSRMTSESTSESKHDTSTSSVTSNETVRDESAPIPIPRQPSVDNKSEMARMILEAIKDVVEEAPSPKLGPFGSPPPGPNDLVIRGQVYAVLESSPRSKPPRPPPPPTKMGWADWTGNCMMTLRNLIPFQEAPSPPKEALSPLKDITNLSPRFASPLSPLSPSVGEGRSVMYQGQRFELIGITLSERLAARSATEPEQLVKDMVDAVVKEEDKENCDTATDNQENSEPLL